MTVSSADFEERFFKEAETVSLQIEVLKETYDDIQAVIQRNQWEPAEGLRILLTLGLGYARGQQMLKADSEEASRLAERLADLESLAAVMKYRTFNFMRDNQILEMRMSALLNDNRGLHNVVRRLRQENEELKEQVRQLTQELESLSAQATTLSTTPTEAPESAPPNLKNRLRRLLGQTR